MHWGRSTWESWAFYGLYLAIYYLLLAVFAGRRLAWLAAAVAAYAVTEAASRTVVLMSAANGGPNPGGPIEIVHCGKCGSDYARAEGHDCDGAEPVTGRPEPREKRKGAGGRG